MSPNTMIRTHNLRVSDLESLSSFYCRLLGMQAFQRDSENLSFGFHPERCRLVFRKSNVAPYVANRNDFYWKIGITLRDLDSAVSFLRDNKVDVSDPVQFRDIGYMSNINDPNGFNIELLQQGFEGNAKSVPQGHPIGGQAILAHITLRVTDISSAQHFFEETLDMRLMSVQPVEDYGFRLYFYSWSDEELPNPDLEAVENRAWLWERPYTFIELQHLQAGGAALQKADIASSGFDGFSYSQVETDELTFVSAADLKHLS